jgi:hypothetical protein
MGQEFFPDEVVAAAAFVAAGLPGGGALRRDSSRPSCAKSILRIVTVLTICTPVG